MKTVSIFLYSFKCRYNNDYATISKISYDKVIKKFEKNVNVVYDKYNKKIT